MLTSRNAHLNFKMSKADYGCLRGIMRRIGTKNMSAAIREVIRRQYREGEKK
jgi:hypothetical protein